MAKQKDNHILENVFFKTAQSKAKVIKKNPLRLKRMIGAASLKFISAASTEGRLKTLKDDFNTLLSMLKAYMKGEYRAIKPQSILTIIAGMLYFLMPTDLIPDFVPVAGFIDDATVLAWVIASVRQETQLFADWASLSKYKTNT